MGGDLRDIDATGTSDKKPLVSAMEGGEEDGGRHPSLSEDGMNSKLFLYYFSTNIYK